MSVLVIAALWTRISGLAHRQFAQDEYYLIKSVQNILEFGVPRFPSGGYYSRGILLQYITAISIFLLGDGLFAYRLPSALFGVGTVVMAYFLGRQGNHKVISGEC
jgi:4-amino-4-deoxy-L-arabinose transferase-like glycosyltransferase